MASPLVLGIETSCDETGVGLVRGHDLLADAVASSVDEHARFGGVVPEVASRAHLEAMVPTFDRALATAGVRPAEIDAVAVTAGPGLAGALLVGVAAAKAYALALGKPLYGVNHLAAHIAVDQLEHGTLPSTVVALLVSGGHSSLLLVTGRDRGGASARGHHRRRGRRGVRQGGPGARAAVPGRTADRQGGGDGDPAAISFPAGASTATPTLDFSFSGPEDGGGPLGGSTAGRRGGGARPGRRRLLPGGGGRRAHPQGGDAAARRHDVRDLDRRRRRGGQLAAALARRGTLRRQAGIKLRVPRPGLCTDNGAMVAALGAEIVSRGLAPSPLDLPADSSLPSPTSSSASRFVTVHRHTPGRGFAGLVPHLHRPCLRHGARRGVPHGPGSGTAFLGSCHCVPAASMLHRCRQARGLGSGNCAMGCTRSAVLARPWRGATGDGSGGRAGPARSRRGRPGRPA